MAKLNPITGHSSHFKHNYNNLEISTLNLQPQVINSNNERKKERKKKKQKNIQ